ncbi:MAG: M14 family metallocarboxypeptidase [Verrucomicrobiota bacterium]
MKRLGKNAGGYRGETIDVQSVLREIHEAALRHGWSIEIFGRQDTWELPALHRRTESNSPGSAPRRIYISAGIHGDEPAGPLAVLRLLLENQWPDAAEIWICPCLNPAGFRLNRREGSQGVDLNRDYLRPATAEIAAHSEWLLRQPRFDFSLCLHEDWESNGFYVYELNPDGRPSPAERMIPEVEKVCPIDRAEIIEGRPARGGIIRPDIDPRSRPQWPEAFFLLQHKTRLSCTLEAPSDFPLAIRVDALVAGVRSGLVPF